MLLSHFQWRNGPKKSVGVRTKSFWTGKSGTSTDMKLEQFFAVDLRLNNHKHDSCALLVQHTRTSCLNYTCRMSVKSTFNQLCFHYGWRSMQPWRIHRQFLLANSLCCLQQMKRIKNSSRRLIKSWSNLFHIVTREETLPSINPACPPARWICRKKQQRHIINHHQIYISENHYRTSWWFLSIHTIFLSFHPHTFFDKVNHIIDLKANLIRVLSNVLIYCPAARPLGSGLWFGSRRRSMTDAPFPLLPVTGRQTTNGWKELEMTVTGKTLLKLTGHHRKTETWGIIVALLYFFYMERTGYWSTTLIYQLLL